MREERCRQLCLSFFQLFTNAFEVKGENVMRALCFCRYSVFGLGSRLYSNFCAFGHFVDDHLRQLGAQPILPMGEGDELSGQEESFLEWARNAFKVKLVTNPHFLDYFALILEKIGSIWVLVIPLLFNVSCCFLAQISFHARPLCGLNRCTYYQAD